MARMGADVMGSIRSGDVNLLFKTNRISIQIVELS